MFGITFRMAPPLFHLFLQKLKGIYQSGKLDTIDIILFRMKKWWRHTQTFPMFGIILHFAVTDL